jgi:hypothetical protein
MAIMSCATLLNVSKSCFEIYPLCFLKFLLWYSKYFAFISESKSVSFIFVGIFIIVSDHCFYACRICNNFYCFLSLTALFHFVSVRQLLRSKFSGTRILCRAFGNLYKNESDARLKVIVKEPLPFIPALVDWITKVNIKYQTGVIFYGLDRFFELFLIKMNKTASLSPKRTYSIR